jgi:hypothetical protein
MDGLTEGRIVHYVLPDDFESKHGVGGRHVPAIVVKVWRQGETGYPPGTVNLQVFVDGSNDDPKGLTHPRWQAWLTSVHFDESGAPGTWHWCNGGWRGLSD